MREKAAGKLSSEECIIRNNLNGSKKTNTTGVQGMRSFWRSSIFCKFLTGTLIITIASFWVLLHHAEHFIVGLPKQRFTVPFRAEKCRPPPLDSHVQFVGSQALVGDENSTTNDIDTRVLVVLRSSSITFRSDIVPILDSNRISYQLVFLTVNVVLPPLSSSGVGSFSVIVFESIRFYYHLDRVNRKLIDDYCRKFSVGIVLFSEQENYDSIEHFEVLHLRIKTGVTNLRDAELNPKSSLLRLTRAGGLLDRLPRGRWNVFSSNHSTYEAVEFARSDGINGLQGQGLAESQRHHTVLLDSGQLDGICRVYFGYGFQFWLHKLLFHDALTYLSHGKLAKPLLRWFVVDIDDIFVGKSGTRMTKEDVKALVSVQNNLQKRVPDFHFNLGYSGDFFLRGNKEENEGDWELMKMANSFWWFSHMWSHIKPHTLNTMAEIKEQLLLNVDFAKKHNIPVNYTYAVSPHHSGVYPVHDLLYEAWIKFYNLKATSTEENPHLNPASLRRGFIYKGVKVLPRQTCGLYTHTYILAEYPKGPRRLEASIYGGELFQTFVNNPINVFMTHLSNYGNDRLALYAFTNVVKFLQCWTNLKLMSAHPTDLAEKYFQIFPEDEEPIWQNPCSDARHKAIWSEEKNCHRLPNFLVIGPQKTGTTALYTFLSMHPGVASSEQSVKTFEEVQFFNGNNYLKGLDWYLDFFADHGNSTSPLLFEKSANYFDAKKAATRIHALLPDVKVIAILMDPVKRAYSWYQHMRSHGFEAATDSFYNILMKDDPEADRAGYTLSQRCLSPGLYAEHLQRWLKLYRASQILILDGHKLKNNPAEVMVQVQRFLKIHIYDYGRKLRFEKEKGFFCPVTTGGASKCLGKSKGRHYPPMDAKSEQFLLNYYKEPNKTLASLLRTLQYPLPDWLKEVTQNGGKNRK